METEISFSSNHVADIPVQKVVSQDKNKIFLTNPSICVILKLYSSKPKLCIYLQTPAILDPVEGCR